MSDERVGNILHEVHRSSFQIHRFLRVCSWESSQSPKLTDGVRLLALVLAVE